MGRLERAGICYMVSGSFASVLYGEPRATRDVDVVVDPTEDQLRSFVASLAGEFYVSPEAAEEALRGRSMFNVVDLQTGWKADLIIRKNRPYSIEEFRRRRPATILGIALEVVSPEDSILSKLEWAKRSGSDRQIEDVAGVIRVQRSALDLEYLSRWAVDLGVDDVLRRVLQEG
ncbi:MAG TPA: hypothetical protein PLB02_00255 [Thermoanaerobaculia bacterium]|nr:hypothetical protein [Thermoanaerobaculia bacterium]HQR65811.1 hypothetical protein [Thermoanaerobaculia bacterium]